MEGPTTQIAILFAKQTLKIEGIKVQLIFRPCNERLKDSELMDKNYYTESIDDQFLDIRLHC